MLFSGAAAQQCGERRPQIAVWRRGESVGKEYPAADRWVP